jgi:hypothetical protein
MRELEEGRSLGHLSTARWDKNVKSDLGIRLILKDAPAEQEEELPARRIGWHSYRLMAVLMLVPGALGYGVYLKWRTTLDTPGSVSKVAALALRAEHREDAVRISWNPKTPVVNRAMDAVLSIRDGDLQPEPLHLSLAQLGEGSVIYGPCKNNVEVRLEVTGPDNTKAGETILAGPAPKEDSTARLVAETRVDSFSRNRTLSGAPVSHHDFGTAQGILLVDVPAAPVLRPEASVLTEQLAAMQPKFVPLPPPDPRPSTIAARQAEQPRTIPAFVAAHALHEARPNLPAEIRATVTSDVEVQVKVQIDESGRVVKIDSVLYTGPASRSLLRATETAARLWEFAPALRENQPVTSETILSFRYNPKTAGN